MRRNQDAHQTRSFLGMTKVRNFTEIPSRYAVTSGCNNAFYWTGECRVSFQQLCQAPVLDLDAENWLALILFSFD